MNMIQVLSFGLVNMFLLGSCNMQSNGSDEMNETAQSKDMRRFSDTTIYVMNHDDSVEVVIDFPEDNLKGTVLLLQGWNFSNTNWCDSTELCKMLLQEGFAVVQPDMKKSIYQWQIYPQTRNDWSEMPTRRWFMDTLVPYLQSFELLGDQKINAAVGLSTGARGALLLGIDGNGLFDKLVCLSGDFDQRKFPNDNLYKGYFGSKSDFPERYEGKENPIDQIASLKCQLYIAHGVNDRIVSIDHSRRLIEKLKAAKINYEYKELLNAGHDYGFWGSQSQQIIEFLRKN